MKGMKVQIARNGKTLALTRPQKMFAQDRTTMETAYAGDGKLLKVLNVKTIGYGSSLHRSSSNSRFKELSHVSVYLFV